MSRTIAYRGILRSGTHAMGHATVESPAQFVEAKYKARWHELDVYDGDDQVGGRHRPPPRDRPPHLVGRVVTAHPHAYPADAAGHALTFTWPPERDHQRTAACTGCSFTAPAPGTGYGRARQLHTEAHAALLAELELEAKADPMAEVLAVLELVGRAVDEVVRVSALALPGQVLVADASVLGQGQGHVLFVHPADADRVRSAVKAAMFAPRPTP